MTQTNKCQHDGEMKTGWDELTCKKCGWILPSGQRIGIHDGWFPSHDAHKEFKKYHTYTGMNEIYPIDLTKYAEIPNMSDLISRELLLKDIQEIEVIGFGGEYIPTRHVTDRITNAPAINSLQNLETQGEHVARVQCDQSVEWNPNLTEDLPIGTRLFTKEYVDKKVADALEEVAKICDDNLMSWADDDWNGAAKDCAKRIRALIKRNAVKEGE